MKYIKDILKKRVLWLTRWVMLQGNSRVTNTERLRSFLSALRPKRTNLQLIRIGGEADGGYLVPDDLKNIKGCFSPGVSNRVYFELELANMGIRCFLADYSVNYPPITHPLFDFEKVYLGSGERTGHFITLKDWVAKKNIDQGDLILQMDIEGAEYEVILDTEIDFLKRFRILVIEFHRLDSLLDSIAFEAINLAFRKILSIFEVVHIHPNNATSPTCYSDFVIPTAMEFTFIRKDRINNKYPAIQFPHPLDRKNVPHKVDLVLPKCWYNSKS